MSTDTTDRTTALLSMSAGNSPLAIIPGKLGEVVQLAEAIVGSGLAPSTLNTADKVTVAILQGLELGVPPMQALSNIAVINGRASIWGDLGMALVLRSGFLVDMEEGHRGEGDNFEGWVTLTRKGIKTPVTKTFSIKDARKAGIWEGRHIPDEKKREASPWVKYPNDMLLWRARWRCWRALFPDVLKGMQGAEEMDENVVDVTPNPPAGPKRNDVASVLNSGTRPQATRDHAPVQNTDAGDNASTEPASGRSSFSGKTIQGEVIPPAGGTTADAGTLFAAADPDRFAFTMMADIEEGLRMAGKKADVDVLADEMAAALATVAPEVKAKAELMMSVRKGELK